MMRTINNFHVNATLIIVVVSLFELNQDGELIKNLASVDNNLVNNLL
jgi:hypothetical protein